MKLIKLIAVIALTVNISWAQDVMQKSMNIMEEGMSEIQKGFLHNSVELIKSGTLKVRKGNELFSDEKVISEYLPKNKKHMVNIASNASQRIKLDANVLELNLENKAYIDAANAYSDMMNACARCHSIVRAW